MNVQTDPSLRISETFETIQGEGRYAGAPSLFIRTSGCNLRCWWCDTPYTSWKPEGEFTTLVDLRALIKNSRSGHVVLTGGEPMLFPWQLSELILCARAYGKRTTIETNGTRFDQQVNPDLWSVSPKLRSSAPQKGSERDLHLRNLVDAKFVEFVSQSKLHDNVQFKFVIQNTHDIWQVEKLIRLHAIPEDAVWAMPESRTTAEAIERGQWLAEECKTRGWNLCLRQHVILWGNRRGV